MGESIEIIQAKDIDPVLGLPDQNEADTFASSLFYEHIESLITFLETGGNQAEKDQNFQEQMDGLMSDLADLAGDTSLSVKGKIIDCLLEKIYEVLGNENLKLETKNALKYCVDEIIDLKKKSLN